MDEASNGGDGLVPQIGEPTPWDYGYLTYYLPLLYHLSENDEFLESMAILFRASASLSLFQVGETLQLKKQILIQVYNFNIVSSFNDSADLLKPVLRICRRCPSTDSGRNCLPDNIVWLYFGRFRRGGDPRGYFAHNPQVSPYRRIIHNLFPLDS